MNLASLGSLILLQKYHTRVPLFEGKALGCNLVEKEWFPDHIYQVLSSLTQSQVPALQNAIRLPKREVSPKDLASHGGERGGLSDFCLKKSNYRTFILSHKRNYTTIYRDTDT